MNHMKLSDRSLFAASRVLTRIHELLAMREPHQLVTRDGKKLFLGDQFRAASSGVDGLHESLMADIEQADHKILTAIRSAITEACNDLRKSLNDAGIETRE